MFARSVLPSTVSFPVSSKILFSRSNLIRRTSASSLPRLILVLITSLASFSVTMSKSCGSVAAVFSSMPRIDLRSSLKSSRLIRAFLSALLNAASSLFLCICGPLILFSISISSFAASIALSLLAIFALPTSLISPAFASLFARASRSRFSFVASLTSPNAISSRSRRRMITSSVSLKGTPASSFCTLTRPCSISVTPWIPLASFSMRSLVSSDTLAPLFSRC